eukprot:GGOE01003118.1.p1 GENE.GGOE01003118.1~~GGOE01003118.1.p1  ORF type:complete len:587 (-),score=130.39 GGOE01003118.1:546-2306(-)
MASNLCSILCRVAEATPTAVALVDGYAPHRRLTYAALYSRVLRLAAALHADLRLPPGAVQALMAPNGFVHLEAMFAASYAGLIHASIPGMLNAKAVAHLAADFGVRLLLFHPTHWARTRGVQQQLASGPSLDLLYICIDTDGAIPEDCPADVVSYEALISGKSDAVRLPHSACPRGYRGGTQQSSDEVGDGGVATDFGTGSLQPPPTSIDDAQPCLLIFTSGSTGSPKAAVVTSAMVLHHLESHYPRIRPEPGHPYLLNSDFSWVSAWIISCCLIQDGATIVVLPGYDRDRFWPLFLSLRPTVHFFLGTLLVDLLDLPPEQLRDIKGFFKLLMYGGSRYPRPLIQKAIALLSPEVALMQVYSSTEAFQTVAYLSPQDHSLCPSPLQFTRLLSVGRPRKEAGVVIVDADGQPCPPGVPGHITLTNTMPSTPGYFRSPQGTAQLLQHGRLITGDLGYLDRDGYLYITGRVSDMIVTKSGLNMYPAEMEDVVAQLPEVKAVVVAGAHSQRGHGFDRIAVFVVPQAGACQADVSAKVIAACREELGGHKIPNEVIMLERFPTGTTNGKVDRRALVRLVASDESGECLCSA